MSKTYAKKENLYIQYVTLSDGHWLSTRVQSDRTVLFGSGHLIASLLHPARILIVDDEEDILLAAWLLLKVRFPDQCDR